MNRNKLLLIVLLVAWGALVFFQKNSYVEPQRVPLKYVKGQTVRKGEAQAQARTPLTIRLDLLEGRTQVVLKKTKNVFAPIKRYVPPPPLPPSVPPPSQAPPPSSVPPPPSPEELAMERARRQLGQFRFLGFFKKGPGRDQAFLARGQELFIVGEQEPVEGSIYLKELRSTHAILLDIPSGAELSLKLSGR